jgi:hypothetical protein
MVTAVKSVVIIGIEGKSQSEALWKIGVRYKVPAEGDWIGVTAIENRFGTVCIETACSDNRAPKLLP